MDRLNLLLPYENKWVALNRNRTKVVADSDDLKNLDKKLKKLKAKNVIISWILPFNASYSPNAK
ncbi:MAG: DUF5678 domain-containing protein [Candidatus Daviesbacteria bacterium]|nr:DUF5678 domain-containing protein [Candidatus Daviesbacteria bacterium]